MEDQEFKGIDYTENKLAKGEYENCRFINCLFSNSDISKIDFMECEFENCDLSMAKITNTAFKDVRFKDCKLLGLHFEDCNPFLLTLGFEGCQLNLSSFYKLKLKNTKFINCILREVDFLETDLSASVFDNCDFAGAIIKNNNFEKADFRRSYNFSIDPEINNIKKAKFSMSALAGLLDKYQIVIE